MNVISLGYEIIPFIICMLVSMIIYLNIDKEDKFTEKINSAIVVHSEWKACFCVCSTLLGILIIGIIGIYVIILPESVHYGITGIITGIGASIAAKVSDKNSGEEA